MLRYLLLIFSISGANAYSQAMFSLSNSSDSQFELKCVNTELADRHGVTSYPFLLKEQAPSVNKKGSLEKLPKLYHEHKEPTTPEKDPYEVNQDAIHEFFFGPKLRADSGDKFSTGVDSASDEDDDVLIQLPMGNVLRAELFNNKSSVHLPSSAFIHRGHCRLKITNDYMQTAVNAFAILLAGNLDDVYALPADYVLHSARTIAMMRITKEKLAALWTVVKAGRKTVEIPFHVLELYRPLFKYVNAREMARLNLSDDRIVTYIGTHAELDRHQMGVVASKYIFLNPNWSKPQYLNIMNNILCGVPMNFMRKVPSDTYLQFTHQIFYHIRACDPLQRRFYLAMMTRTQALGKSYSWSARDVSRLGLLLAEVEGPDLGAIIPEAMSGITAQVMLEIPAHNLQHLTEVQLRYLGLKPLNILARKLKFYQDKLRSKGAYKRSIYSAIILTVILLLLYYMQTAVNAFAILLAGNLDDVYALPADYVLHSARTIAMMRITKEKLAALWTVVKAGRKTVEIPFHVLELYRPLFKYVNAREMARLNLSDDRIVTYIGTHAELDRHQMGVVASKYIFLNPNWSKPQYLNIMNNILCGVPMNFMRKVPSDTYLQFTHQIFYHIRACDPLQRRFYLAMMTRTQALGKSYSWSARDVSRLGLLLAEVEGPDLGAIIPEAMSGITAQVMLEIPAHNLQHLTEVQLRYLGLKPLNILARKLKFYQDKLRSKGAYKRSIYSAIILTVILLLL